MNPNLSATSVTALGRNTTAYSSTNTDSLSSPIFTTASQTSAVKTTGDQVQEFALGTMKYMVSPHPEHGQAVKVSMQGQCLCVSVATVVVTAPGAHTDNVAVAKVEWETPFSAHPENWQNELLDRVLDHLPRSLTTGEKP